MKLKYDRGEDILSVETAEDGVIAYAEQTGSFIAHFSEDGHLLLLEILDASEFLADVLKTTLRSQEDVPSLAA